MTPEQTLTHLRKLDRIVAALKANPLAPHIRIFGSALHKDVPGDIDAFCEGPSDLPEPTHADAARSYLLLAVKGGYHGNYGCFDPFLLTLSGKLYSRNERYDAGIDWVRAKRDTGRQIIEAGRLGTPVLGFDRRLADEWLTQQEAPPCRP